MAGHMQGRAQNSSHRHTHSQPQSLQTAQTRKRPDSRTFTQDSTSIYSQPKPDDPSNPARPKLRTSCDGCQEAKLGCSQEKPTCRRCMRHGIPCIYSPFRRIGRPRKSTNPRTSNSTGPGKSRNQKETVDEPTKVSSIEGLPELETDSHFGSMFFDPVPAPPSSPVSPESANGASWYPWTADGNSLCNGLPMNLDQSNNLIDGADPFSNTLEYIDLETCLENHHNMFMDCSMSKGEGTFHGMGLSMQPTPPSSISAEMMNVDEAMPSKFDTDGNLLAWTTEHAQLEQSNTISSPTSSSTDGVPGLKLETTDAASGSGILKALRTNGLDISFQSRINKPSNTQAFAPSPELTPPPSAGNLPGRTPCEQRCSSALIKQLACLNQHLSDESITSLDTVLQVEKDAHSLCQKIVTCIPCITNKSSYLLFTMVLEQIIHLLEKSISQNAPSQESCALCIGAFEFDQDTKRFLLKQYLLARMDRFGDLLNQFAQVIRNGDGDVEAEDSISNKSNDIGEATPDYNFNVVKDILRDVYRRLDSLRAIIETWG